MRLAVGALVLVGCKFTAPHVSSDAQRDGEAVDAPVDAATDAAFECSTARLVCPGSTPVVLACGADCWVGCTNGTPIDHASAAGYCASWGGRLAPFYNASELSCVRALIAPGSAMWLGLVQDPAATLPGDGWSWNADGLAPPYTFWANGQPNDGDGVESGAEQCAYSSSTVDWQDEPCTSLFARFACRHP